MEVTLTINQLMYIYNFEITMYFFSDGRVQTNIKFYFTTEPTDPANLVGFFFHGLFMFNCLKKKNSNVQGFSLIDSTW